MKHNQSEQQTGEGNAPRVTMRMSVTFAPNRVTGSEIQAAAERTGARLIGGASEQGQLIYEATNGDIGAFRGAVELIGLRASFTK